MEPIPRTAKSVARDGIHQSTVSLKFLRIILRFLRFEVLPSFSVRFSSFDAFLFIVSMRKKRIYT